MRVVPILLAAAGPAGCADWPPFSSGSRQQFVEAVWKSVADLIHREPNSASFEQGERSMLKCGAQHGEVGSDPVRVGYARATVALPTHVRRGGYGLFPLSVLLSEPDSSSLEALEMPVDTLVLSQGNRTWVFVSLPVVGVTFTTVQSLERAVQRIKWNGNAKETDSVGADSCTVVTVSASHTHSGPDAVGLWGGVSTHLLWWKAQDDHRALFLEPLARAVVASASAAFGSLSPGQFDLRQGTLSTTALKRRTEKDGLSDRSTVNSHLLQLSPGLYFWVADVHAATSLGKGSGAALPGDYPQYLQEQLSRSQSAPFRLLYAPGLIGDSYPVESDDWPESWARSLRHEVDSLDPGLSDAELSLAQLDLCVLPTSRLYGVIEAWSELWSGEAVADPCDARQSGWRTLRLQRVQIGGVTYIFTPFELFPSAAQQLASLLHKEMPTIGASAASSLDSPAKSEENGMVIFVSLSNGFMGYAGITRLDDLKSYHRLLSVFEPLPSQSTH
jgi:hypothetical protein